MVSSNVSFKRLHMCAMDVPAQVGQLTFWPVLFFRLLGRLSLLLQLSLFPFVFGPFYDQLDCPIIGLVVGLLAGRLCLLWPSESHLLSLGILWRLPLRLTSLQDLWPALILTSLASRCPPSAPSKKTRMFYCVIKFSLKFITWDIVNYS